MGVPGGIALRPLVRPYAVFPTIIPCYRGAYQDRRNAVSPGKPAIHYCHPPFPRCILYTHNFLIFPIDKRIGKVYY